MKNSLNNNFSNREESHKNYSIKFADEIVAKISENVDFKKFFQAVFDEKILTERQEKILKLLYWWDDGIAKTAYCVAKTLWLTSTGVMNMRWSAFVNILKSEAYKDLFPEENEENYYSVDDILKQTQEKVLQNLDDDLDNYEYHIDDLSSLEDISINEEFDIIEMIENEQIREILMDVLWNEDFLPNKEKREKIFMDLYGFPDGVMKKMSEVTKKYKITYQGVNRGQKQFITKVLENPEIRKKLFDIWDANNFWKK